MKTRSLPFYSALFAFSLLLYLRTLAPGLLDGDSAEFQMAAWNFSLVHPTGYPLYLLLGGIFSHLVPIGDPAYRMNLFSALCSALAVTFLAAAIYRISQSRIGALVGAASLAVSTLFWQQAVVAEVYALNSLFISLLTWLAFRWYERQTARNFLVWLFMLALALMHHRSVILLLPAFAIFFILTLYRFRAHFHDENLYFALSKIRLLWFSVAFSLLIAAIYLLVPLRAAQTPYRDLIVSSSHSIFPFDTSPKGMLDYVLGREFQGDLFWGGSVSLDRLVFSAGQLITYMNPGLAFLGIYALISMRLWNLLSFWLIGSLTIAIFNSVYFIRDILDYYTPIHVQFAFVMGIGAGFMIGVSYELIAKRRALAVVGAIIIILILISPAPNLYWNLQVNDRSSLTTIRDKWNRILELPLGDDALILSNDRDEIVPMWYMQYVEGKQRNWLGLFPLITPASEHANVVRVIENVASSARPIYLVKPMLGLEIKFPVDARAPLPRVSAQPYPMPTHSNNVPLGTAVRVVGYTPMPESPRTDSEFRLAVYWQVTQHLARDYTTFVHLLDASGNKIAQGNDHKVGGDFYPTSLWQVGETLRDEFTIPLPSNLQAGTFRVLVGMYAQPDSETLAEPQEIGTIEIIHQSR